MATKKSEAATVTRIKASGSGTKNKSVKTVTKAVVTASNEPKKSKRPSAFGLFMGVIGYFKGAWFELRQVRWPTRKATWSLTGAVLLFTSFFVILILLLDALFKYVFELIIG